MGGQRWMLKAWRGWKSAPVRGLGFETIIELAKRRPRHWWDCLLSRILMNCRLGMDLLVESRRTRWPQPNRNFRCRYHLRQTAPKIISEPVSCGNQSLFCWEDPSRWRQGWRRVGGTTAMMVKLGSQEQLSERSSSERPQMTPVSDLPRSAALKPQNRPVGKKGVAKRRRAGSRNTQNRQWVISRRPSVLGTSV